MTLDQAKADKVRVLDRILNLTPEQLHRALELMKQDPDLVDLFKGDKVTTS